MARVVCVANQKGGVGKTTTAINLATCLAKAGNESLLVDLDPQCNSTTGLGQPTTERHPLVANQRLEESALRTSIESLRLLPGCRGLDDIELLADQTNQQQTLREQLISQTDRFDYVLLDCPPSLGPLTRSALIASNEVLMPIQCEYYAMEGLTQMIHLIREVMKQPNRQLQFGGIVMTMYDHELELTEQVEEEVREFFGEIVFDTVIPRDVAVSEAPSFGQPVIDYAPRSRGTRAYVELCMEVLDRG